MDEANDGLREAAGGDALVVVLTNVPDEETAEALEHALVGERLAACVNRLAPVRSTYRWQGVVETAQEIPLVVKSTARRWPALAARIAALHPYEVPEIVCWPATQVFPAYAQWVRDSTAS